MERNKTNMNNTKTNRQEIKTDKTKFINKKDEKDKEILIGKDLDKVDKIEEGFNSKKRKLLNKLLK